MTVTPLPPVQEFCPEFTVFRYVGISRTYPGEFLVGQSEGLVSQKVWSGPWATGRYVFRKLWPTVSVSDFNFWRPKFLKGRRGPKSVFLQSVPSLHIFLELCEFILFRRCLEEPLPPNVTVWLKQVVTPWHVVMDCCSYKKKVGAATLKRVEEAVDVQKARDFPERLVELYAAPSGFTATAEPGKTMTSAIISCLTDRIKKGETGIPLVELQLILEEKQKNQGSNNTPIVKIPSKLLFERFPF